MRKSLSFVVVSGLFLFSLMARADDQAIEERMRRDITFLASDECEGRGPGTAGIDKAADYIAAEFRKSGLKPAGAAGTYFQPFEILDRSETDGPSSVRLKLWNSPRTG